MAPVTVADSGSLDKVLDLGSSTSRPGRRACGVGDPRKDRCLLV